jgi:adhesin transport system outer membrane protein
MKKHDRDSRLSSRAGRRLRLVAIAQAVALLVQPATAWTQQLPPAPSAPVAPAPSRSASGPVTDGTALLTLRQVVEHAVTNNPEVLSKWNAIRAAEGERDAARGGLLPRLDVTAGVGPERRNFGGGYNRSSNSITLTQLLYDGYATYGELERLNHTARVRMFEFFDTSETVALEAARAYFDVIRYRELVRLAEDNFVEHRAVYAQIERRVNARIARAVDLEQISGRLALAEANLLTEIANLHDTSARFQRVVGRLPTQNMPVPPPLARDLPPDAATAIVRVQEQHPALLAAIESVRASQSALDSRGGAMKPRLDFRVRRDAGNNLSGIPGSSYTNTAEVVLSWNLFNGFADQARDRQFASQLNVARDVRDKTCRDLRQTLVIAYNDIGKLKEQTEFLVAHETSIAKALAAYRAQFDIGQRTLLDLLDTENEQFQARRAVVNANADLNIAYARTQQGQGTLLRSLELTGLKSGGEAELEKWAIGADAARQCPVEPVVVPRVEREVLMQRAVQTANRAVVLARERALQEQMLAQQPGQALPGQPVPVPAVPGAPAPVVPVVPAAPATTPPAVPVPTQPASRPAATAPADEQTVRLAMETWRAAWARRDLDAYLDSYAPNFTPANGVTRDEWEKRRRNIVGKSRGVQLALVNPQVTVQGNRATATFVQQYRSASYEDVVTKTLEWQREGGRWRIVSEQSAPAPR